MKIRVIYYFIHILERLACYLILNNILIRNSYSFLHDYYSLSHPIFMCFFCILSCQEYLFLSSMLIKLYDWRKPFQICFKYCLVETWIFSLKLPLNQDIPLIVAFYPEFHAKCDPLDAVYSASIFRV